MSSVKITAKGKLGTHDVEAEVINPGNWFGKVWLIEIGIGNGNHFLAVEADSASDAIDELADDEKHGHHINVEEPDLKDYDEENASRAGNDGHIVDLDNCAIHGQEGIANGRGMPWPCRYFFEGGPAEGADPLTLEFCIDCDRPVFDGTGTCQICLEKDL